jgi:hypothetical protein
MNACAHTLPFVPSTHSQCARACLARCASRIQTADTTRRSLEYSIYEQERHAAEEKLQLIDRKRGQSRGVCEPQRSLVSRPPSMRRYRGERRSSLSMCMC